MTRAKADKFWNEFQSSGLSYRKFIEKKFGPLSEDPETLETLPEKIDRLSEDLCSELFRLAHDPLFDFSEECFIESLRYDVLSSVKRALSIYFSEVYKK